MSRSAILLSILGALLLTVAWFLLLVNPIRSGITDTEDMITTAEDEEFRLRAQRTALQRIEDNMLAYMAAIGELDKSIPPTPQTASLIDDLSVLADDTGVLWESGSYGNPQEIEGVQFLEIPVNINIEGQFFEVLGYLYGIADMERLVRVESIGISPQQDEAGFTILNVAITARAFTSGGLFIPTPDGVGGDDGGAPPEDGGAPPEDDGEPPEDGEAEARAAMAGVI